MCLWEQVKDSADGDRTLWWDYIHELHKQCYSVINEDCSQRAHKKLNLDWTATQKCVKESFTSADESKWGNKDVNNVKIDNEIKYWKQYGTNIYPSIVIN